MVCVLPTTTAININITIVLLISAVTAWHEKVVERANLGDGVGVRGQLLAESPKIGEPDGFTISIVCRELLLWWDWLGVNKVSSKVHKQACNVCSVP